MLYSTTFHPLHALTQKWPQVEIRGSAQVHTEKGCLENVSICVNVGTGHFEGPKLLLKSEG